MKAIYNLLIIVVEFVLKLIAPFNTKIKLGVIGRSETFKILQPINKTDRTIWLHCASLGEYEQGLPVFEIIRNQYPEHKIILSFFSPSGYTIRKHSPIADYVVYLPIDTKANAKRFLNLVHPELTVFVKYDIWPNYLNTLKQQGGHAILISALLRPNQIFFKPYGSFMKSALFTFNHIFTQDDASKTLLLQQGYENTTVTGDTRFDRVNNQLQVNNTLDFIANFKDDSICVVIGSSWPEDEKLLVPYINNCKYDNVKFIIAPHNISDNITNALAKRLTLPTAIYTQKDAADLNTARVFIVDTIGLLTKIYNYADIAYIGGAMGSTGLHNTLEAAVFGVPIIIGQHYEGFPEAKAMIALQSMLSISNDDELKQALNTLIEDKKLRHDLGLKNKNYINTNKGAVVQIANYLRKYL